MARWRTPKGSFSRHRYDWQLDYANFGFGGEQAGFSSTSVVSLYNNDNMGRAFAVTAVMAFVSYPPQLAAWDVRQGSEGALTAYSLVRPVDPRNAAIAGQILGFSEGGGDSTASEGVFRADGGFVLERAGAPIAIVPARYRFRVWNSNYPLTAYSPNPWLWVTFWWTYY